MTSNQRIQAVLAGASIAGLLEYLSEHEKKMGSVVRLKQHIRKFTMNNEDIGKIAFNTVMEASAKYPDGIKADISTVIEAIYFNHMEQMRLLYGNQIGDLVTRCASKLYIEDLDKESTKNGYEVSDTFKEVIQNNTFKYLKEKDNGIR